jgi:hypothetical protein
MEKGDIVVRWCMGMAFRDLAKTWITSFGISLDGKAVTKTAHALIA